MTTELDAAISELNAVLDEIQQIEQSPEYKCYIDAYEHISFNRFKLDSQCFATCVAYKPVIKEKVSRLSDLRFRQTELQNLIKHIILDL